MKDSNVLKKGSWILPFIINCKEKPIPLVKIKELYLKGPVQFKLSSIPLDRQFVKP